MVATLWGTTAPTDFLVDSTGFDLFQPSVADSGGGSFGVAWTSTQGVTVQFYDVVGNVDPALGTIVLSTSASATEVSLTAGGAVGYAAAWQESGSLKVRYIGLSGPVGSALTLSQAAGDTNHDPATSGYAIDGPNGKPIVDGFNVAFIATSAGDLLTAAQIAAGYGRVMLQRFAVPLDSKVDPIGPPVAAGLDGIVGGDTDAAVNVGNENGLGAAVIGRDVAVASDHADQDTLVAWIGVDNTVHARLYRVDGSAITIAGGAVTGIASLDNLGAAAAGSDLKVISNGSGFVVAWVDAAGFIRSEIFAAGGASTFAASAATLMDTNTALPAGETFTGDFAIGALLDTNGFALTVGGQDGSGNRDLFIQSHNAGGGTDGVLTTVNTTVAGDQSAVALAGLIGDRVVAVFQDDPTNAAGDQGIRASILDTHTAGVVLSGDVGGNGAPKAIADQLIGTVFDDTLSGLQNDDELYGALGDDTLVGGAGDDVLDGGGNGVAGDTAVFTGNRSGYTIEHLGGDLFTVTDNRGGSPDGTDTVRGVENLQFADVNVTTASIIASVVPITPTAWGWTNADGDNAPDQGGSPDVDGFLVNHVKAGNGDIDTNAYVADSVGEFIAVAWEHTASGTTDSHILGQFYDVIGAPDAFIPNTIALSDGIGIETNAVIVSGGANSGWGVVFEQQDNATDTSRELRTNFVGPGQLTSVELSVLGEGPNVDQHDAAMSGSFLDRTLTSPVGGSVLPTGMNEGYNVAWVSTHLDGADGVLAADYGRIMLQRFEVPLDALGNPGAPVAGGVDGIAGLDNAYGTGDAAVWIGDEAGTGAGGALGRNPSTAALHGFETAVIWIEQDGAGGERVAGQAYDDLGQVIPIAGFDNISAGFGVATGTTAHIVSAGAVNFGIVWVTVDGTSPSGLSVVGTMYSPTGAGLNGEGFGFGAPPPAKLFELPAGVSASDLQLTVSGISGEDSADLVVGWKVTTIGGDADMMAQHVKVALDPVTGFAIALAAEGNSITVSAETTGNQDGGTIAGLLGDRFVAVYHDDNNGYTDGNDIVARIIDTRDAASPDPITGDLIRAGLPQARRDVLIGTNGDDHIRGDISDADGRVDYIFAGMGNDTIEGGPGVRGAAGIPEIIDGGEGDDTSVYTGRLEDYSITINGDGSYEIIDLRPATNAAGAPIQNDGIDNIYNIEHLLFLDTAHGGAGAQFIDLEFPGTPPAPPPGYDGTPVAWSLDDTSANKEISVDTSAGVQSGINVINLQDGAGLTWISAGNQVWAITYDTTGKPDPILLGQNTQLTDGTFSSNTVSALDVAMTGGLGMTAVWESTDGTGDTSIHLRFASTNTHIVADPAGGVPGPGLAGGEIVVVGSNAAGTAVDPVIQGYEIVNDQNDTLEVGFHVGFELKDDGALDTSTGDAYGALMLARYEIPVYDILVDAAGLPILDGAGQGQLATDINGNLVPSTVDSFGTGSETAPVSIGLDGLRGTADDGQAIVLTDQGLFAANAVPGTANVLQGRDISIGSLHDGQLVVSYIGTDEMVHLKIFVPSVDQVGDRETNSGLLGSDIVATGITSYSEFAIPFATTLGAVASPQQTAFVVPQQNGSFGVFWAAGDGAGVAIRGIIYSGAGTNWSPSPIITFKTGLPAGVDFEVAPTGVTPGGLEDGFFVSWEFGSGTTGQRFDMTGATVGAQIVVGDPTTGTPGLHSTAGIDDGRMIVGYEDGGDVSAQFLDNREPGIALIGPRTGAPRDVIVGTVGDDAIDGRALADELHGGLGNDLITMGSGADIGFGGLGDDTIIGGTGQDQLLGEEGDDVLWGGLSGPADPKVSREVEDGLVTAGFVQVDAGGNAIADVNGNLTTVGNPFGFGPMTVEIGADIISGGDGIDTISYQGEVSDFLVDLGLGVVASDRDRDGIFVIEDLIGQLVDDGAGATPFQFNLDIENATGGYGNDAITGSGLANVLAGGAGNDSLDGAGGNDFLQGGAGNDLLIGGAGFDKAVYDDAITTLTASMFSVVAGNWVVTTGTAEGTDILTGIELVDGNRFVLVGASSDFATLAQAFASGALLEGDVVLTRNADGSITETVFTNDNPSPPVAHDDIAATNEDTAVHINVRSNDSDPDGSAIRVDASSLTATHGIASVDANGDILFTPDANYYGAATISYRVLDVPVGANAQPLQSNAATVSVTIAAVEDAPTAADDEGVAIEAGVNPGVAAADNLLLNDIDPDLPADTLSVVNVTGIAGGPIAVGVNTLINGQFGTLSVSADGTYTYQANNALAAVNQLTTGQTLADNFTYPMRDAAGALSTANLVITIEGANDAPILANAIADRTASAVLPFTYTLAANTFTDVDTANLVLSARLANGAALSTIGVTFNAQTRTFSGAGMPAGAYDIQVSAFDGQSTATDIFRLTVAANQAPTDILFGGVTAPASVAVAETGGTVTTLTGVDPEGGTLTYSLASDSDGRFAIAGNQLVVANASLVDFEDPSNPAHSFSVKVMARDPQGAARVETLTITTSNVAENTVAGATAGDNTLNGTAGNDIINGLAGRDTMNGGAGNDTYFVDNSGDKVNENAGGGTDTIYVSNITSWTLSANVENLIYTGAANSTSWRGNALNNTLAGGSGNDQLQGDAGNDHLVGNAGNDTLTGGDGIDRLYGGAGNDTLDGGNGDDFLFGGVGNDTYNVSNGNDRIGLAAGFGIDTVTGFDADATGGQDLIDLTAYGLTASAIGSSVVISGSASQTVVTIGTDVITLNGVNVAAVDSLDFVFA